MSDYVRNNIPGGDPNQPLSYLWVEYNQSESQTQSGRGGYDNTQILGPQRFLDHGTVYLRLQDTDAAQPYESSQVKTAYCHVGTHVNGVDDLTGGGTPWGPAAGSRVVQCNTVAFVGGLEMPQTMLSRGLYTESATMIDIYERLAINGAKNPNRHVNRFRFSGIFPSTTGPHLHFEVHAAARVDTFRKNGEQDPAEWIGGECQW